MNDANDKTWHRETITRATEETLLLLRDASILSRCYLAGGTALALHFGHRTSEDLDFFTEELFNEQVLLQRLQQLPAVSAVTTGPHTLHAEIKRTKVSFLGYTYPLLAPLSHFLDTAVADPKDIACMKISAIASRGAKRDFVDLYVVANRFGLPALLELFRQKFAAAHYNIVHVLKSLVYFADAEKDPMPHMLIPLVWDEVTQFFTREVPPMLQ
jgi:nucleotidyltransferase AbiEii toxin of type IV toxin-antitoxin system